MVIFFRKPKNIADLKVYGTSLKGTDRSKIKIAIIDDEDFEYFDILRTHDFNIKVFKDIDDIKAMQAYDIILCDIKGVGKAFKSKFEGAHLIAEIRKYYPSKYVIAYSGHSFDPSYNVFFQIADQMLKKDIDSDEWVENLDLAISKSMDPLNQWYKIREFLLEKEIPLLNILRLEDEYVRSIINKESLFPSKKLLDHLSNDVKDVLKGFAGSLIFKLLTN